MANYTVAKGRAVRHGEGGGEGAVFTNHLAGQTIELTDEEAEGLLAGGHVLTARDARRAERAAQAAAEEEEDDGEDAPVVPVVTVTATGVGMQISEGTQIEAATEVEEAPRRGPGRPRGH